MRDRLTFLAFTYGSNMSTKRLRARTPSASFVATGQLAQHALAWDKPGIDGSGKCNATHTASPLDVVWGVLFEIGTREKPMLDNAEGLGHGYDEKRVEILTSEGPMSALMYYATDICETLVPYDWYKAHVLKGAREHGLPADYIGSIERVPSCADPDPERSAQNELLH